MQRSSSKYLDDLEKDIDVPTHRSTNEVFEESQTSCRLRWWKMLEFDNEDLEQAFAVYDRVASRKMNRVMYVLCCVAFIPSPVMDVLQRENYLDLLPWRLALLVTSVTFTLAQFHSFVERRSVFFMSVVVLIIGCVSSVTTRLENRDMYAPVGLLLVLQAGMTMLVVPHRVMTFLATTIALYALFDRIVISRVHATVVVPMAGCFVFILFIGSVVTFYNELYRRRTFLALKLLADDIEALEQEQEMNQALLKNIFPAEILARMGDSHDRLALTDAFDNVSILFCDVKGIEEYVQGRSADFLIQVLNDIFSEFDMLTAQYHIEKVKTIGSVFMAVSGCPRRSEGHAKSMVDYAFAIREVVRGYSKEHDAALTAVIGINSGSVVAGIVGKQRYVFDIWGDSVNVASRMESHGIPDQIQISLATRQLLGDNDYKYEDRGAVTIKGKGLMRCYLVHQHLSEMDSGKRTFRSRLAPQSLLDYINSEMGTGTTRRRRMHAQASRQASRRSSNGLASGPLSTRSGGRTGRMELVSLREEEAVQQEEEEDVADTQAVMEFVDDKKKRFTMHFENPSLEQQFITRMFEKVGLKIFRVLLLFGAALLVCFAALDAYGVLVTPELGHEWILLAPLLLGSLVPFTSFLLVACAPNAAQGHHIQLGAASLWTMATSLLVRLALCPVGAMRFHLAYVVMLYTYMACFVGLRFVVILGFGAYLLLASVSLMLVVGKVDDSIADSSLRNSVLIAHITSFIIAVAANRGLETNQRKDFLLRHVAESKRVHTVEEKKTSDALLLNVLPAEVAVELRAGSSCMARDFHNGSLLVCDIVKFTVFSSKKEPKDLVRILDALFHRFDDLVEKHQCEKIKTIGDCYVAASGLLSPGKDAAVRICRLGLEMHQAVAEMNTEFGEDIHLRLGVHTGRMLGGVIGRKKFMWDLWGPSVARAFQMEATGLPDRVHVSRETMVCLGGAFRAKQRAPAENDGAPTYLLIPDGESFSESSDQWESEKWHFNPGLGAE